jgi:F0F1-type ATP synthase assembly protein I
MPLDYRPNGSDNQNWGRYLGIGLEIGIGCVLGYLVGAWLDKRFGWNGKGVLIGVCIGLAAGMYLMIKDAIRANKD